jgi:ribosomal protein S18 acetylase RimI-like enzyme
VPQVTVQVEELTEVTGEVVEAFARLLPQVSTSAVPLDHAALTAIAQSEAVTLLVARSGGQIIGSLSLAMFRVPSGVRAWIEDVVVDQQARRQGAGHALVSEAVRIAAEAGARTLDLTSRPARAAAGNLYEQAGFELRDTRVYRHGLGKTS